MLNFFLVFICVLSLTSFSVRAESVQIEQIGPSLKNPWGMDFISDKEVLVTEKKGRIYRINISDNSSNEILNVPKVDSTMQGGLLDIIYNDGVVFYCYSKETSKGIALAIDSAIIVDDKLKKK